SGEPSGLDSLVGRAFGPYDVLEELGRGGMGVVYRAYQATLGRQFALKIFRGALGSEHGLRFAREGQAAARLGKHPNLVQVFDAGTVDGVPYIAMELVKGEPLD